MLPSGSIARNALISFGAFSGPHACVPIAAASASPGNATLMARPPAAEPEATTKCRRVIEEFKVPFMAGLPYVLIIAAARWIALRMRVYVPQRQMLVRLASISASEGFG